MKENEDNLLPELTKRKLKGTVLAERGMIPDGRPPEAPEKNQEHESKNRNSSSLTTLSSNFF